MIHDCLSAPEKDSYLLTELPKDIAARISITTEYSQRRGKCSTNSSCEQTAYRSRY